MRHAWTLATLLLLSGCAGGASGDDAGAVQGTIATGQALEDAATIRVLVVDDSQAPIANAQVALIELSLTATSDEGGAARFENIAPGSYAMQAARLGYESSAKKVDVAANEEASVTFTLVALAVVEPYHDTFGPFIGNFECRMSTPTTIGPCTGDTTHDQELNEMVFPGDRDRLFFNLTSDGWQTLVGEARWTPGSAATSSGMAIYPSYEAREDTHWWCEADGATPLRFHYESEGDSDCNSQGDTDPEPSMEINPLVLVADPGFGGLSPENPPARVIFQQRFELMMTVFYHEPAPAEYSAFADA